MASERVQRQIDRPKERYIRSEPLSYSTIWRILKNYHFNSAEETVPNMEDIFGLELTSRIPSTTQQLDIETSGLMDGDQR